MEEKDFYSTGKVAKMVGINYANVFALRRRAGVTPVKYKGCRTVWYTKEQAALMVKVHQNPWLGVNAEVKEVVYS